MDTMFNKMELGSRAKKVTWPISDLQGAVARRSIESASGPAAATTTTVRCSTAATDDFGRAKS